MVKRANLKKGRSELKHELRRSSAFERADSVRLSGYRLLRTVLLGTIAVTFAIFWLGEQYGIDRDVILDFLLTSAVFVGGLVLLAGLGAVCLLLFKRWRR